MKLHISVSAVGQQVLPKEPAVIDISFHTHGIFRDFFLFLLLTEGKLCPFEAFCVGRAKEKKKKEKKRQILSSAVRNGIIL